MKTIKKKDTLWYLAGFYFLLRLPFLLKLPIFNDEAIYLDWGNRILQEEVSAFYSLYDGKQPLLIWVFGVFEQLIPDPLLAGRLVAIFAGFAGLVGLYILAKKLTSRKIAFLASLLYIATPIFVFYDRQALMESSIAAIGIWSFWFFEKYLEKLNTKYVIWLGIILGVGFFIKSSAALFLIPIFAIGAMEFMKFPQKRARLVSGVFTFGFYLLIILSPLLLQKQVGLIFSRSDRYVGFSFANLLSNLINSFKISFWYLFPTTFVLGIFGLFVFFKERRDFFKTNLFLWMMSPLFVSVLLANQTQSRYLVAYLVLFLIPIAKGILELPKKLGQTRFVFVVLPLIASFWLILAPFNYLRTLSGLAKTSDVSVYYYHYTSGVGIDKVRDFLQEKARRGSILVGVRLDAGNPESAMFTYYGAKRHDRIRAINFDKRTVDVPEDLEYIELPIPLYFVSRDNHLAGMDDYLIEVERYYKKDNKHSIGIYELKKKNE